MRKGCRSLVIVLAVVMAFGLAGAVSAYAAATADRPGNGSGFGTLKQPAKKVSHKGDYMEHAALVMFRSEKAVKKGAARTALQSGEQAIDDIQIEELWTFETDPGTTGSDKGGKDIWSTVRSGDAFVAEDESAGKGTARKTSAKGASAAAKGATVSTAAAKGATAAAKGASLSTAASYGSIALVKSKSLSAEEIVKRMKARSDVLYAEPNYRVHTCSVNDPYFGYQWSMQGGDAGTPEYSETTPNIQARWNQGTTGTDSIVAVVDTGVDYTHPDLADNMWHNTHYPTLKGEYGYDFNAGDDDPMDEYGHGTHCAGIIGARGNNGIGISGVNQKVRIMALRTLNEQGSAYLSHEIAAYNYINKAIDLGEPVRAINNSWGGGEDSDIFRELVDIVGEKGAISVCAAGNESNDNDFGGEYPADIDSPYLISVAATREDGELVSFSNYGKESVDVAAPGTDILSTVPGDTYNPVLYGSSQSSISEHYNDYESESGGWGSPSDLREELYLNGEKYTGSSGKRKISLSTANEGFMNSGHSMQLEAKNLSAGDLIYMTIPYEISADTRTAPSFSFTGRAEATADEMGFLAAMDVPQGTDVNYDEELELVTGVPLLKDDFDNWSHLSFQTMEDYELQEALEEAGDLRPGDLDPTKREIVLLIGAQRAGSVTVQIDDMGMSRQDLKGTAAFGKYDFMSGTSMAAPYISGAVALEAAARPESAEDPATLTNEVVSHAKAGALQIRQKGSFDFTKTPVELGPRIGSIKVDKAGGKITISGSGLNPSGGLTVQIGPDEKEMQTAQILSQADKEVVVRDNGWINNLENIRVTGYDGKEASRSFVYLVDGKKRFTYAGSAEDGGFREAITTDGRYVYGVDSQYAEVQRIDTKHLKRAPKQIASLKPEKLFGSKASKNAQYAMKFGDDLVYMNGKLYSVIEYGEADESENEDEDIWIEFGAGRGSGSEEEFFDDEGEGSGEMAIYSGSFRLVSIDVKSGRVTNLGRLPSDLQRTSDYTMAAYNGRLLFMGGYNHTSRELTAGVKVFDPAKKKSKRWSGSVNMPQVRAGGKALQSGSRLIYTMGYSQPADEDTEDYRMPATMVFNGRSWKVSRVSGERSIEPMLPGETVRRGGKTYLKFDGTIGAAKKGLVFMGCAAADYGDTFLYDAEKDVYRDTGYHFVSWEDYEGLRGVAAGSKICGFWGDDIYTAKLAGGSGMVRIKVKKNAGGTVSVAKEIPAGSDAKLTVKAKKGYAIKSVRIGAKKAVLKKNATKKTITLKRLTKDQTVKVVFRKK